MPAMTSRSRVLAALAHRQPDRVPRDLGGTTATGINIAAYRRLVDHLGLPEKPALLNERVRLADISDTVLRRFGSDTRPLTPGGSFSVGAPNPDGTFTDGYGVVRALPSEEGHYYVVHAPLAGVLSRDDIAAAARSWPRPDDPALTDGMADRARALHQGTDYAVILNLPLGSIHTAQFLRGFEAWLMDLVNDPALSIYFLDTLLERWLESARRLIDAAGAHTDVLFYAEDVAFHNGPMVSPRTYRTIIRPYQERVFRALHRMSPAPILYHNCGSVTWQIPDMIEWGIAGLNPVQVTSHDMGDTASLKQRFGGDICFWGGIDTGHVMPRGTVDEVHAEVHRRLGDLASGGGYVLASVHNLQAEVPPESICALWEAADDWAAP